MSARQNLAGILEQWLQLTKEESAAIQSSGWLEFQRIKARKAVLRPALAQALQQCAADGEAVAGSVRTQVGRIISLLTRNGAALSARRRRLQERQQALEQAARNLERIRRSYNRPPPRPAWHSYS